MKDADYCEVILCDFLIQLCQGVKAANLKVRVTEKEATAILGNAPKQKPQPEG